MTSSSTRRDANAIRQSLAGYTAASPSPSPSPSPSLSPSPLLHSARRPSFNSSLSSSLDQQSFPRRTSAFAEDPHESPSQYRPLTPSFSSSTPSLTASLSNSHRLASSQPLSQSQLSSSAALDYPPRQSSPYIPSYSRTSQTTPQSSVHTSHPSHPTSSVSKNAKDNKAPPPSYSSSLLATRYASLRPPASIADNNTAFSKQATVPLTYPRPIFEQGVGYFVGVWRRSPWDTLSQPPQSLNGSNGYLHVDTYDADDGQVFNWVPYHDAKHPTDWYYLECDDLKLNYVTSKLRMTDSIEHAALWRLEGFKSFRGEKGDISIKIFGEDGLILCCSIQEKSVALLTDEQADTKDAAGNYLYNNAWECSPELDDPDISSWLDEYLGDDFEDTDLIPNIPSSLFDKVEFT